MMIIVMDETCGLVKCAAQRIGYFLLETEDDRLIIRYDGL